MAKKKKIKAPKKPKASASVHAWKRYDERHKEWTKKVHQREADERTRQSLMKKYRG